jgi:hypothetical protein
MGLNFHRARDPLDNRLGKRDEWKMGNFLCELKDPMPKTEPFDQYSDRYDAWFEKNSAVYRAELEAIRRMLPPRESKGLEVGVGSGKFAVPLGISIGVEPSEQMARKAERLNIQVVRGVAEDLPFQTANSILFSWSRRFVSSTMFLHPSGKRFEY